MCADRLESAPEFGEAEVSLGPIPLSRTKANNWIFGSDGLALRPEEAALVAHAIAGWSVTEAHLGHIFGTLIGATEPVTMDMYAAIRSFEVQRKLLETAAEKLLPVHYFDMLIAVMVVVARSQYIRHRFAHGIWGSSQDIPAALLWAEPKSFWLTRVAKIRYWRTIKEFKAETILNEPRISRSDIMVYRNKDLRKACEEIETSYKYANLIYEMVASKPSRRKKIYDLLRTLPDIESALQSRTKSQGRVLKAPRKPSAKAGS